MVCASFHFITTINKHYKEKLAICDLCHFLFVWAWAIVDTIHNTNDGLPILEGSILCWPVLTLLGGQRILALLFVKSVASQTCIHQCPRDMR